MRDHDLIEELLAASALGGLEPHDRAELERAMASHGPDCSECRRLRDELDEVAGRLAFGLEPVPVSPELEERTIRRALGTMPAHRVRPGRARRGTFVRWTAGIAAAAVLFAGGWLARDLSTNTGNVQIPSRVVTFQGSAGNLAAAFDPDRSGVYLFGANLVRPPDGRVYEMWLIEDGTPVPGACFTPSAGGAVFTFVDANVANAQTMAVTVEPSSCSNAPTTEPVLTAPL